MSMSTHVVGIKPPNDKWLRMKQIWENCEVIGLDIPEEVAKFFNYETPDAAGVVVTVPKSEWNNDHASGIEIKVKEIPADVEIIRFYNSW